MARRYDLSQFARIRPIDVESRDRDIAQTIELVPEVLAHNGIERRDPTAATRSVRWMTPGKAVPPDWDAAKAFQIAYYMSVVVYACTRLHANTLSSLPFRVGADPAKPQDFDPNAPLAKLLGPPPGGPAPKLSARRLWAWTTAQRIVTGRNGWEAELDPSGKPVALWPLPSTSLTPIPTQQGVEWFSGFEYGRTGDKRKLPVERVIYDWDPRGDDFRQPESALEAAGLAISVDVMQSRYDYAFLRNDARPAALVVTEAFSDRDEYEAFKHQWNSQYQGAQNAGKIAFLEAEGAEGVTGAVDVKVLGFSPKDAQAAQRHAAAMERTAIALGTPWSLLDASGRTFDNASQEWQNWIRTRLMPLLADFADMVNMQLAPRLGSNVGWFDLTSLGIDAKTDPVTASVGAPSMVQAQLMKINEARADYGLPPIPDGDRMMTAEEIAALSGAAPAPVPARAVEPEVRDLPPVEIPEEDPQLRRARVWTANDATVRNLERIWERKLRRLFARQAKSVLARLDAKRGRQALGRGVRALFDEVFDPEHWLLETADEMRALYEQIMATSGARMAERFGVAFDLEAQYAQDFVLARANQLAGQVTDTTYQAITQTLADGVAQGEGIPELAVRVQEVFDQASTTRAVTIARTEVISAFNGSASAVASSYGPDVVAGQEWIATLDSRTRDSHAAANGEQVGIGERFSNGLAYPGDPSGDASEVVNCRCTVAFLTPDEFQRGKPRMAPHRSAVAALSMISPGTFDEKRLRSALRRAA